ncbi:MAG TPA: hypothetical protein VFK02_01285, partial [Kofleriaceae bacterium]|nr:hypothetical protein [Kofleriaceae bacterium]
DRPQADRRRRRVRHLRARDQLHVPRGIAARWISKPPSLGRARGRRLRDGAVRDVTISPRRDDQGAWRLVVYLTVFLIGFDLIRLALAAIELARQRTRG